MFYLFSKEKIRRNFSCCSNWEDKYMYIIKLGEYLPPLPTNMRNSGNLIDGCQSQVWIVMIVDTCGIAQLYGDSDTVIVKGLITILFALYQRLTPAEILVYDVQPFFNELALTQHLTPSRSQGLEAMIRSIRGKAALC